MRVHQSKSKEYDLKDPEKESKLLKQHRQELQKKKKYDPKEVRKMTSSKGWTTFMRPLLEKFGDANRLLSSDITAENYEIEKKTIRKFQAVLSMVDRVVEEANEE